LRRHPHRVWGVVRFVRGARSALESLGELDRVVAHFIVPSAWPISSRSARRLEVVAHGSDVRLVARLPKRLRMRVLGELLSGGARFRVVSRDLLDQLCSAGPAELRDRCTVQPCAIDLGKVADRSEARAELGLPPDQRLVVVVGRLVRSKRVEVALSAATLMPATRVVVIGTGPERHRLGARFASVEFCGKLPRPATLRWIAAADAMICASRAEGASTVVREARALGTPVVAAPSGDLTEWAAADPGISVVASPKGMATDRPFPWCEPTVGHRILPWLCKGTTNLRSYRRNRG
jgi:glycosyltransferase involved in cell wall biosynthesis